MNQRLNQQQAQQLTNDAQLQAQRRTFEEAEEVIRADCEQTKVPATLARKLAGTIAAEPVVAKPWWRRLFNA